MLPLQLAENVDEARALEETLAASGSAAVTVGDKSYTLDRGMVSYAISEKTVTVESFLPHVVEPSFGIGRIMTGILEHCFNIRPGVFEFRTFCDVVVSKSWHISHCK